MDLTTTYDVFDIIGPIMVGPSSSHTAGAVRIGLMAGQLCNYNPTELEVLFHGSLASTYSFHKTDVAVVAGILGFTVDNDDIKDSIKIAQNRGIKVNIGVIEIEDAHPSTIMIKLKDKDGSKFSVRSATVGGGNIIIEEVNDNLVNINGKQHTLLINSNSSVTYELEKFIQQNISKDYTVTTKTKSERYLNITCNCKLEVKSIERLRNMDSVEEVYYFEPVMMTVSNNKIKGFTSIEELVRLSREKNCKISDTVINLEICRSNRTEDEVIDEMKRNYFAMKESIKNGNKGENKLLANIFSGNAKKMNEFVEDKRSICGISLSKVIRNALAVMEVNGSMGKILACPTAGSAGTLPAAVITIAESNAIEDDSVIRALFTGAGIGMVVAEKATLSGSVGGCQAECGVASAMAAAVITELFGGDSNHVVNSSSIALGNVLGLVCDPVAGTVELPCIQRNVMAATNAIVSAEMALAGIDSVIPLDEMIGALDEVGKLMDNSLKDTLGAGISNTPTARKIERELLVN